jgi:hypothetical protein
MSGMNVSGGTAQTSAPVTSAANSGQGHFELPIAEQPASVASPPVETAPQSTPQESVPLEELDAHNKGLRGRDDVTAEERGRYRGRTVDLSSRDTIADLEEQERSPDGTVDLSRPSGERSGKGFRDPDAEFGGDPNIPKKPGTPTEPSLALKMPDVGAIAHNTFDYAQDHPMQVAGIAALAVGVGVLAIFAPPAGVAALRTAAVVAL